MPAVRIFSLYAAAAVFFDFLLQITAFVAVLSLDFKRQENNRLDLFCCIKEPKLNYSSDRNCNVYIVMKWFAGVLLSDFVRPVVVSIFWRKNSRIKRARSWQFCCILVKTALTNCFQKTWFVTRNCSYDTGKEMLRFFSLEEKTITHLQ